MESLSRADLVELVRCIIEARGDEGQAYRWIRQVQDAVPHPNVTDLIFFHEPELTPEQIIDEAFRFRAAPLPPPAEA